jgi:hypothetical protein
MDQTTIPKNFASVIYDFTKDLSITFPEYVHLWNDMIYPELPGDLLTQIFEHCKTVYPARFFDILYQNDDIFLEESTTNVCFLPNVDFKLLFNTEGVSENTKKSIWKYLQLVLFTVIGEVKDKDTFGETMNMFDGIDEKDLHEKLSETMSGLTDFFKNMESSTDDSKQPAENTEEFKNMFDKMNGMPNMDNIQDHLKTLFNGKIGSLAKEMAEEISGEFADLLGADVNNTDNPQDVVKKLMKNPKKIMDLLKSVSGKLDNKMKSGEISREEIMKEAGDLIGKMKDMGGNDEFHNMFKKVAKDMGGLGGLAANMGGMGGLGNIGDLMGKLGGLGNIGDLMGNLGGLGKNVRLDTNAMDRMVKKEKLKENAKRRVEIKRLQQQAEQLKREEQEKAQIEIQRQLAAKYSLQQGTTPDKFVFRLNGEDTQEKSFIHPDLLKEMEEEDKLKMAKSQASHNKKKKNKK